MSEAKTATTSPGDEREAFKRHIQATEKREPMLWSTAFANSIVERGPMPQHLKGRYFIRDDQKAWEAWQARAALSSSEWVSVEERQPEPGSTVLAFWEPRSGPVTNQCWGLASYWPGHWHNPEDDEDDYCAPTFWRRLPARPSTQGDQQ